MSESLQLATFAAGTRLHEIPGRVVDTAKILVLDGLASALVGSSTPSAEIVASLAPTSGGNAGSTRPPTSRESEHQFVSSVFMRDWLTTPSYAALINGTMIGAFETDHTLSAGSCHPGAAVLPAVLAVAERDHLDGTAFLTAVIMGYEVCCRVGLAATRAVEDQRGFHGPGTNAPFGSAVGAAVAMGLSPTDTLNAMGIAGSHSAGLLEFAQEGAMTKRLHVGRGAQTGLESAMLASRGFTGPAAVLEGRYGFLHAFSPSPQPRQLTQSLGERYTLPDISLKAYPCHISFQGIIAAVERWRRDGMLSMSDVPTITVRSVGRLMEPRFGAREPTSTLGAQYSLPFSIAIAMLRDARDPANFGEGTLWDPDVRALARRVKLEPLASPVTEASAGDTTAEVELALRGSAADRVSVTDWKGASSRPFTYEDVATKFRSYASRLIPEPVIERVIGLVRSLPHVRDLGQLNEEFRVAEPTMKEFPGADR